MVIATSQGFRFSNFSQQSASLHTVNFVRGHPFITFAKFSGFWAPSPPLFAVSRNLSVLLFAKLATSFTPLPPLGANVINGSPLSRDMPHRKWRENKTWVLLRVSFCHIHSTLRHVAFDTTFCAHMSSGHPVGPLMNRDVLGKLRAGTFCLHQPQVKMEYFNEHKAQFDFHNYYSLFYSSNFIWNLIWWIFKWFAEMRRANIRF